MKTNNFSFIKSRLIYGIAYLISFLPVSVLYSMSSLLYSIAWKIFGYRKSVITQNLARSFPQKNYKQIKDIANSYAHYLFSMLAEWIKSLSSTEKSVFRRVNFKNIEILDTDENIFLLMGHYGNWESLISVSILLNREVYAVYQEPHCSSSDYLSRKMRSRFGANLLESKNVVRFVLENKKPSVYLFISDQSPTIYSKLHLTFLNQPTFVYDGVERLVKRVGGRVLYTEVMPISSRGSYQISFSEIGLDSEITKEFFNRLEQTILQAPQYWLWSHRRWKHREESV